jgi:hypothetical protein
MTYSLTTLQGDFGRYPYEYKRGDRNHVKNTKRNYHTLIIKLWGSPDPSLEALSGDDSPLSEAMGYWQEAIGDFFDGVLTDTTGLSGNEIDYLNGFWSKIWHGIKKVGAAMKTAGKLVGKTALHVGKQAVSQMVPGAGAAIDAATSAAKKLASMAKGAKARVLNAKNAITQEYNQDSTTTARPSQSRVTRTGKNVNRNLAPITAKDLINAPSSSVNSRAATAERQPTTAMDTVKKFAIPAAALALLRFLI